MLEAVRQTCQRYYDEIPAGTGQAIAKSALYSFAASAILFSTRPSSVNLSRPVVAAGVSALASSIHALTAPLFNKVFDRNDPPYLHSEIVKLFVDMALVHVAVQQTPLKACAEIFGTMSKTHVFVLYSSELLRSTAKLILGIISLLDPYGSRHVREFCENRLGIDLSRPATPIYISL